MDDAGGGLRVQALLLARVRRQLAPDAAHAREHGVEVAQRVLLRGAARGGARRGVLEQRLERRRVLFNGEVGGAKVFAEELVGEAEEGLVLERSRKERTRGQQRRGKERARRGVIKIMSGEHGRGRRIAERIERAYEEEVLAMPERGLLVLSHLFAGWAAKKCQARGNMKRRGSLEGMAMEGDFGDGGGGCTSQLGPDHRWDYVAASFWHQPFRKTEPGDGKAMVDGRT